VFFWFQVSGFGFQVSGSVAAVVSINVSWTCKQACTTINAYPLET
jgi:hypothetical protein